MIRLRYIGIDPGAIPGWRVFTSGDEDDAPDELATSLVAGGLFVVCEAASPPSEPPPPSPPPVSEFVVEPVTSPAPEVEQEHV